MVDSQLLREERPAEGASELEEILARANALFRAEGSQSLDGSVAEKIEELQHYDVLAMDRVAAIMAWGRSGSVLLASYLDGHEDVIMLPELCGWRLHAFTERYPSLPLTDKLLAYPAFASKLAPFFEGNFAISPRQYFAAVQAIAASSDRWPREFLESRRAFIVFAHIAYTLALGRRPTSSRPLIVYAQHDADRVAARHLVEDFPQAKFIHTVRDPISSCDRSFHQLLDTVAERHTYLAYSVLEFLTDSQRDRPQPGMELRTRAIRFEDLHCDIAGTMSNVADWLGIPYRATLLDSTFNGIPYLVTRDGVTWSGPRPQQAQRQASHLWPKDRALLFVLFYENFVQWHYPCPRILKHLLVRCLLLTSLVLPMKMEIVAAKQIWKRSVLPSLRRRNFARAMKSLAGIGLCRMKIIRLFVSVFFQRCAHDTKLLPVDPKQTTEPLG